MKGINTPGQVQESGGFTPPLLSQAASEVSHLAFPALARQEPSRCLQVAKRDCLDNFT